MINTSDMDKFTLLRWAALIDGVNMIYNKASENGISENNINLKQNHLIRYIDERTERIRTV
jgi:hypothetical protein